MLTVEEQQAKVSAAARPLRAEAVPIALAAGRTLADDVRARVDVPLFDNSAMDGYAVIFADVEAATAEHPAELRLSLIHI